MKVDSSHVVSRSILIIYNEGTSPEYDLFFRLNLLTDKHS